MSHADEAKFIFGIFARFEAGEGAGQKAVMLQAGEVEVVEIAFTFGLVLPGALDESKVALGALEADAELGDGAVEDFIGGVAGEEPVAEFGLAFGGGDAAGGWGGGGVHGRIP